jgi:argininosuccinate synthase
MIFFILLNGNALPLDKQLKLVSLASRSSIEIADHLIDSITDRFYLLASRPYLAAPATTILARAHAALLSGSTS